MYTYQQRLEYAKRLQMLQRAVVIKDNIHLTYQYKNRNKAYNHIDTVQDRINKSIIENAVNGNGESIKNLDKQGEKLIHDTLTNERKRLHRDKNHKAVNQATKSNSQYYTNIFNYRRKKIGESLSDKIENELRSDALKDLSDMDKIKHLQEKFDGHGTKRLKNIVTDAMHTNESNIGWIKAVEDGFNYKVWKNGRVAKGRTRAWHKEKIISAVPIDETFDIYGSYPAHMMYPGDLNGGAENVANCRCWLLYTNRIPSNLRRKTVFNVSPSFQQLWDKSREPAVKLNTPLKKHVGGIKKASFKIRGKSKSENKVDLFKKINKNVRVNKEKVKNKGSKIKNISKKMRVYLKNSHLPFDKFHSPSKKSKKPKNWRITNVDNLPEDVSTPIKDLIKEFESYEDKIFNGNEWGQVYNLTKGFIDEIQTDDNPDSVAPYRDKDYGMDKLIVIHNHINGDPFSSADLAKALYDQENICSIVVVAPEYIYIADLRYGGSIGKKNAQKVFDAAQRIYGEEWNKVMRLGGNSWGDVYDNMWGRYKSDKTINKYIKRWRKIKK